MKNYLLMYFRNLSMAFIFAFALLSCFSCVQSNKALNAASDKPDTNTVLKYRKDGTLCSANQVDENDMVHGMRVTYYRDGKTVYSRVSFEHGIKQGPCIKYYRNGQAFEHISFKDGEKHGLFRKYHKNGQLLAEYEYENGIALPGLKEYSPEGALITENGAATQRFYLRPGETLEKEIKIIAEIPTDLGNILVREMTYQLSAKNPE